MKAKDVLTDYHVVQALVSLNNFCKSEQFNVLKTPPYNRRVVFLHIPLGLRWVNNPLGNLLLELKEKLDKHNGERPNYSTKNTNTKRQHTYDGVVYSEYVSEYSKHFKRTMEIINEYGELVNLAKTYTYYSGLHEEYINSLIWIAKRDAARNLANTILVDGEEITLNHRVTHISLEDVIKASNNVIEALKALNLEGIEYES